MVMIVKMVNRLLATASVCNCCGSMVTGYALHECVVPKRASKACRSSSDQVTSVRFNFCPNKLRCAFALHAGTYPNHSIACSMCAPQKTAPLYCCARLEIAHPNLCVCNLCQTQKALHHCFERLERAAAADPLGRPRFFSPGIFIEFKSRSAALPGRSIPSTKRMCSHCPRIEKHSQLQTLLTPSVAADARLPSTTTTWWTKNMRMWDKLVAG